MKLPNETERFWIYGTATLNMAVTLRSALPPTSVLAKKLARLEALLQEAVLEAGTPYHDAAAAQQQLDRRRAQANARRFTGQ